MKNNIFKYIGEELKKVLKDIFSKDKNRIKRQIPNILTLTRGIISPILIVISIMINSIEMSFIVILMSALTDCFDGWYARKYNYVSEFGALIDTICDKIFTLCIILPIFNYDFKIFTFIITMEIIISLINGYRKLSGKKTKSSIAGKIKTVFLDGSMVICYLSYLINIERVIVDLTLYITVFLQVITIIGYSLNYKERK